MIRYQAVSYTHLDVYKRQGLYEAIESDLKDDTVKQKWMEEFSRELVTAVAA